MEDKKVENTQLIMYIEALLRAQNSRLLTPSEDRIDDAVVDTSLATSDANAPGCWSVTGEGGGRGGGVVEVVEVDVAKMDHKDLHLGIRWSRRAWIFYQKNYPAKNNPTAPSGL